MHTLREQAARDYLGTLAEVAAMGCRAVELAGYGGLPPEQLRSALDRIGLRAVSAHVPEGRFRREPEAALEEAALLGCRYLVVPSLDRRAFGSSDAIRRAAGHLNRWGELCRRRGLRLGYHNHGWEFRDVEGRAGYEWLASATEPDLVHLQIDVYWALHAGLEPAALIRRHSGRVPTLHVKDMSGQPDRADTTVGEGSCPGRRSSPPPGRQRRAG